MRFLSRAVAAEGEFSRARRGLMISTWVLAALAGCGTVAAPPELEAARAAYLKAQSGPATQFTPDQLDNAKKALEKAEAEFREEPGAQRTRDFAYVAQRKAELAAATGAAEQAKRQMEKARGDFERIATGELRKTSGELRKTRSDLQSERKARVAAEKRAKELMEGLARLASVKKEKRGMVITLSGSVLFGSGKSYLLPAAQEKLNEVADALKAQDRTMLVEGHTDSRGSHSSNQELSLRRAQSVRDYLVSRGVPSENIRAAGVGPDRPVESNATAEGRANNRRVEIIVEEPR